MTTITIGADPEFFVQRRRHVISGHTFPIGTKQEPMATTHGSIQVDGVLVECNVTPALTSVGFLKNVRDVMNDLQLAVSREVRDAKIVARPSMFFGHSRLSTLPEYAQKLGCEPDFNAWTGQKNPRPDKDLPIRTGSGHIHVGWTKDENPRSRRYIEMCAELAKQLDYYIGLPSVIWDKDQNRRRLYGSAGAFRPKSYGMEYRVPSNAWTKTDKLIEWVFNQTKRATEKWLDNSLYEHVYGSMPRGFINDGNPNWVKEYPGLAEDILK